MGALDYRLQKQILLNSSGLSERLAKFEREVIFEVYFRRMDGRYPAEIPEGMRELYMIDMEMIATYLLGQYPNDTLLQKLILF